MSPEFVPEAVKAKLDLYDILLRKWQSKINLVSPSSLQEADIRHFADSIQLNAYIPEGVRTLYDLGSGAGFPGLVLAMLQPEISVHLIEADQRKAAFLKTVSRETMTPVLVHNGRIEALKLLPPDIVTARALASLTELLTLSKPWWEMNKDMILIFPKGSSANTEIAEAQTQYRFDFEKHVSKTDSKGSILVLTNVAVRLIDCA